MEMGQRKLLTVWYVKKDNRCEYVDIFEGCISNCR
jgi:hypothetical protein